jgi:hypothetical protein
MDEDQNAEPPRPALKLVSDQPQPMVDEQRYKDGIRWPLRELAANLMRVARGAGKPYEIGPQVAGVLNAFEEYRAAVGHWPPSDVLANMLDLRRDYDDLVGLGEHNLNWTFAIQTVMRGSLQFAASELLGQNTQRAAGRSEMIEGVREVEEIRERNRNKYQQQPKPAPRKRR